MGWRRHWRVLVGFLQVCRVRTRAARVVAAPIGLSYMFFTMHLLKQLDCFDAGHQFYHKWALLMDLKDLLAGPKGYIKCDIAVCCNGQTVKVNQPAIFYVRFLFSKLFELVIWSFCLPQSIYLFGDFVRLKDEL